MSAVDWEDVVGDASGVEVAFVWTDSGDDDDDDDDEEVFTESESASASAEAVSTRSGFGSCCFRITIASGSTLTISPGLNR